VCVLVLLKGNLLRHTVT